jgi:amidase
MERRISRREVLHAALAVPLAGLTTSCAGGARKVADAGPLADLDAVATAAAIVAGQLSVQEAVEAAIQRAQAIEPRINAVVTDAYERARATAATPLTGPLAGVPTFVKDLDDVRGLPTRSGSRSFGLSPATGQGPYVDALERAGLVFLGKSSTPEFGLTGSTEPLLHGPTRNPWNLDYSPGGSSGGAAALVAARVDRRWRIDPRAGVVLRRLRPQAVARTHRAARASVRPGRDRQQPCSLDHGPRQRAVARGYGAGWRRRSLRTGRLRP